MGSPAAHRACLRCHEVKAPDEFDYGPSGKRRRGVCRECVTTTGDRIRPAGRKPRTVATWRDDEGRWVRRCSTCRDVKPLGPDSFYVDNPTRTGIGRYGYRCKACARASSTERHRARRTDPERLARRRAQSRAAQRRYAQRHPERIREQRRRDAARIAADRQLVQERRENQRIAKRLRAERQGRTVKETRPIPRTTNGGPQLPATPLAAAVQRATMRRQATVEEVCLGLGIPSRTYTAWRSGERPSVQMDVADKVITRLGLLWWDVYDEDEWPEAHARAEALFG